MKSLRKFLLLTLILTLIGRIDSACQTFANTTAVVTIKGTESTVILNECSINPAVEKIVIQTCVDQIYEGTFKDLPNLNDVRIVGANTKTIEPGFLQNLPNLTYVTINLNPLKEIRRGQFSNIKIDLIDLENNKIWRIQREAFENLTAEILVLNKNNLRSIEKGWFKNSSINNLQVATNKVTWVGLNTFSEIKNLEYLDLLDNSIYYIQDGTFTGIRLRQLDLSENMLTQTNFLANTKIGYVHIGINMLSNMFINSSAEIQSMTIYPNPWRCECLRKLWPYFEARKIKLREIYPNPWRCECLRKLWPYFEARKIKLREAPTYVKWKEEFPVCVVQSTECSNEVNVDETRKC
ncbi:BspA type Leucine rich repeat region (6 copies) [Popillia japonica]|uniref:BspA type Leucine rich repeat region (6 copies) n=1 Tax=Popillia japonica TaxID=7064 RepID=A0AAW1MJ54_POPJA